MKVFEYAPHMYCAYAELGNGEYISCTYTEETLKHPCHFDRFKEILNVRQEMEEE